MGFDPFSPLSAAQFNLLCLPAHQLTSDRFEEYLKVVQQCSRVPRAKILITGESGESLSTPGDELLLFNTSSNFNSSKAQRSLLEPNRVPQAILGFVDCTELPRDPEVQADDLEQIRDSFSRHVSQSFDATVVSRLILFGDSVGNTLDGMCKVPGESKELSFMIITTFLAELAEDAFLALEQRLRSEPPRVRSPRPVPNGSNTTIGHSASESEKNLSEESPRKGSQTSTPSPEVLRQPVATSNLTPLGKLITRGFVHLQTGHWHEAFEQLSEGLRLARDANDSVWQGRALEALLVCMLLFTWAGIEFAIPQNSFSASRLAGGSAYTKALLEANKMPSDFLGNTKTQKSPLSLTASIPGFVAIIIDLYELAAGHASDTMPAATVIESRVRLANLLIVLKTNGCLLTESAIRQLVGVDSKVDLSIPDNPPFVVLKSSTLSDMLMQSAIEAQTRLSVQESALVYVAVSHSLSNLRMERKQGFQLRVLIQNLAPMLIEARRIGAAEAGVHPSTGVSAITSTTDYGSPDTMHGVRALLFLTLRAYGLPATFQGSSPQSTNIESHDLIRSQIAAWEAVNLTGDVMVKQEIIKLCIRASDALPDPEFSLFLMGYLLNVGRQGLTLSSFGANPSPMIPIEEQNRLLNGIKTIVASADRLGPPNIRAHYWDGFLVREVRAAAEQHAGRLMPHSAQDLSLTSSTGTETKKGPFIYNPFSQVKVPDGGIILVKDEMASFDVILQNPLDVEIEIDDICLIAEGCGFAPSHHSIVLGPLCSQVFKLTGVPKQSGSLKITGCKATIHGCYQQNFGILSDHWKPQKIQKERACRARRTTSDKLELLTVRVPHSGNLQLEVVESLPQLHLSACSVEQRSMMLLEGETEFFNVTLRNDADRDVDLVLFSYEDSVSTQLRQALNNKDLLATDVYELQYQLASNPAVRRHHHPTESQKGKSAIQIASTSSATFSFQVFGKPGLTKITVLIDYAYLGKPRKEVEGVFYTRQLKLTINTTVNGSIDVSRCNIMPVHDNFEFERLTATMINKVSSALTSSPLKRNIMESKDWCLLQLDLRNVWPQPVKIAIDVDVRSQDDDEPCWENAYAHLLQPGQVERAILFCTRLYISDTTVPIPSLDHKRQFVVSTSKMSIEAEAAGRESFWYREKLLERLRATWETEDGTRNGVVDIRKVIRLSPRMIEAIQIEHVQLEFDLETARAEDQTGVTMLSKSHFVLERNTFAKVTVRIKNRTTDDLRLLLRLQPSLRNQPHSIALDLSKRFAWSGVLQKPLREVLEPGDERSSDLGIVALAAGKYEINATVEELRGTTRIDEPVKIKNGSSGGRRVWHARRPCLIDAIYSSNSDAAQPS